MLRSASAAARHALQLASAQLRSERALQHCDAAAHRALTPAWRHGAHARASTEAALADEVFISDACAKVRSQRCVSCGATTARPADAPRRCHAPRRAAAARADTRGARPSGQRLWRRRACCCCRAAQRNRAARGGGGRRLLRLPVPLPAGRAGARAGRQARSSPAARGAVGTCVGADTLSLLLRRVFERDGARVAVDPVSFGFLRGATVDYAEELIRAAFTVRSNPNSESGCGCGSSFAAKA